MTTADTADAAAEAKAPYDSAPDTLAHIQRVRELLFDVRENLFRRGIVHDASKLREPEKAAFDRASSLRHLTYGSPEYAQSKAALGDALAHHYAINSHHPEHHPNGVADMSLLDLLEMLVDWRAATERHADGDLGRSLAINRTRFGINDQLAAVLHRTAVELGFLNAESDAGR